MCQKKLNILLVGSFENSWSTNIEMKIGLENIGHNVKTYDYRNYKKSNSYTYKFLVKIFSLLRTFNIKFLRDFYYDLCNFKLNSYNIINLVKDCQFDWVIFIKTDTINPTLLNEIKKETKVFYYFMDPLYVAKKIRIELYDYNSNISSTLTTYLSEIYNNKYNCNFIAVRQGILANNWKPIENQRYSRDVIFVGSKDKYRSKIINYLLKSGIRVECFGHGWSKNPIYQKNLIKELNSTKIILNFTRDNLCHSVRVAQTLACNNFLISNSTISLREDFVNGKHLVLFTDKEDLVKKIKYYLNNINELKKIAKNGQSYVLQNLTWENIFLNIFKQID